MKPKRFTFQFLVALVALVVAYLASAVVVNPRGYFDSDLFPQAVLDSRRDKMKLFERYNATKPVEGLILGSSRAMKIDPRELGDFTGVRFFNFCVDSARSEDYLAIYRWAKSHDSRLRCLVVALDVEALHDDDEPDERLKSNAPLFRELSGEASVSSVAWARDSLGQLKKVMSRYYAQEMVRSLLAKFHPKASSMSFDADGFLHYGGWERQISQGSFDFEANLNKSQEEYQRRFRGMSGLSPLRRRRLEQLLGEAAQDGVKAVLWITPLHPDLARSLSSTTQYKRLLDETRDYTSSLGSRFGEAPFDFSEPSLFGGNASDWYDGGHIAPGNASLITRQLAARLGMKHGI